MLLLLRSSVTITPADIAMSEANRDCRADTSLAVDVPWFKSFPLGSLAFLWVDFTVGGVGADPSSVTCTVQDPNGVETVYTYAPSSGEITKDTGTGKYHLPLVVDIPGVWHYQWKGTGAAHAVRQRKFYVADSAFSFTQAYGSYKNALPAKLTVYDYTGTEPSTTAVRDALHLAFKNGVPRVYWKDAYIWAAADAYNSGGTLANHTGMKLRVMDPDGVEVSYTGGSLQNPGSGRYKRSVLLDKAGLWSFRYEVDSQTFVLADEWWVYVIAGEF